MRTYRDYLDKRGISKTPVVVRALEPASSAGEHTIDSGAVRQYNLEPCKRSAN